VSIQTGSHGVPQLTSAYRAMVASGHVPSSPDATTASVVPAGGLGADDEYVAVSLPGADAVEDALQKCYRDVIRPVAWLLCAIGWRPFPFLVSHLWHHRVVAVAYPLFLALCLSAEYAARIAVAVLTDQSDRLSELLLQGIATAVLWGFGLRFFRREDGQAFQELSALIETVYLRCGPGQTASDAGGKLSQLGLTATLRTYLMVGWSALALYVALALWLAVVAALDVAATVDAPWWMYATVAVPVVVGYLLENGVVIVTILTYWLSVRVHVRYAEWIRDRLVTRSLDLPAAERELLALRSLVAQTNRGWAVPVSVLAFFLAVRAVLFQIAWVLATEATATAQAVVGAVLYIALFLVTLYPAASFSDKSSALAATAWTMRAEHTYRLARYVSVHVAVGMCLCGG
jgi:hypothetical protein